MDAQQKPVRGGHGYHTPVMADEVTKYMVLNPDGLYLDATLGGGGHSTRILASLGSQGRLVGLDRDSEAVEISRGIFSQDSRMRIEHSEFSRLGEFCSEGSLSGALFDLGVSSRQLDAKARGFSYMAGTPLDMRMGSQGPDAGDLLKNWDEWELSSILRRNADIDQARRLARTLVAEIEAGAELTSDLIRKAVDQLPGIHGDNRNSLLARVFQAIRMEVNDEMGQVEAGLKAAVRALAPGGRLCVLSYHSVEDRKVKETLAGFEKDCLCASNLPVCMCGGSNRKLQKVLRKPELPTQAERDRNPRARSAKLRVAERVGTP